MNGNKDLSAIEIYKKLLLAGAISDLRYKKSQLEIDFSKLDLADAALVAGRTHDLKLLLQANKSSGQSILIAGSDNQLLPSLQQEAWWHWMGHSENERRSMNVPIVFYLQSVDLPSVKDAIRSAILANRSLLSRFNINNGVLQVTLNKIETLEIEEEDWSNTPSGHLYSVLERRVGQLAGRAVPANGQWLVRVCILRAPAEVSVVVLTLNHMVADATSALLLKSQIHRILCKEEKQLQANISYFDFCAWERKWFSQYGETLINYWMVWKRRQSILKSPMRGVPLVWTVGYKSIISFSLELECIAGIRLRAKRENTTPFVVLLTIWCITIAVWSGKASFSIRSLADGRKSAELLSVVGLFTASDALEINIEPRASFSEVLKNIEFEFRVAQRLRTPAIHAVEPHLIGSYGRKVELSNTIPIVFNYTSRRYFASRMNGLEVGGTTRWPPILMRADAEFRPYSASPIDLTMTDLGRAIDSKFALHDDLLTREEQQSLMSTYFRILFDVCIRRDGI